MQRKTYRRALFLDRDAPQGDKFSHAKAAWGLDKKLGRALFHKLAADVGVDATLKFQAAGEVGDDPVRIELCEQAAEGAKDRALLVKALRLAYSSDQDRAVWFTALLLKRWPEREWDSLQRGLDGQHRKRVSALLAPPEKTNPA